jgi:hypothetical protein
MNRSLPKIAGQVRLSGPHEGEREGRLSGARLARDPQQAPTAV